MIGFEWDEKKAKANLKNHKISIEEGATIFNDPFVAMIPDLEHSITEERNLGIGTSIKGRVLVVVYTERGANRRMISCRKATPAEREIYEKANY
jgi:uncharacterized DUF497 family protein